MFFSGLGGSVMTDSERKQDQKRDNILRKMLNMPPDPRISKKDNPKVKKPAKYAVLN